jgi:hypothetical protein
VPIRTNRGRAAVYRRLWGWPLRSPRHLATVVLFILAIGMVLGYVLPKVVGGSSAAAPAPGPSTSAVPSASSTPPPSQGATGGVPPPPSSQSVTQTRQSPSENKVPARAEPAALDIATKWAKAFVNHDNVGAAQWLDGLRPYTTDEYLATNLAKIDPKVVPQNKVTGEPTATPDSYTSSVTVDVPTDDKKLRLTLIRTAGGWRVDEHNEVD